MTDLHLGLPAIILIIVVALLFDFINGLHDAANSIATVVSTRVLPPKFAVAWAAFFNSIAFLFFGLHVAETMGTGIVRPDLIDPLVVLAGLIGAIGWSCFTWVLGFPSSSSHALIGGLVGAGIGKGGFDAIATEGFAKTTAAIVLSPAAGFLIAVCIILGVLRLLRNAQPFAVDRKFRRLQLVSASLYSLGHGGNDAQKTMGLIAVLLFSQGLMGKEFHVPLWVVLASQLAMGLGTLLGGWRIVRTMGSKITELKPLQGFCAETAGAVSLFASTWLGIPVSTTHTITGAIIGVGLMRPNSSVRWGLAGNIAVAWVCTIPAAGLVGFIIYRFVAFFI